MSHADCAFLDSARVCPSGDQSVGPSCPLLRWMSESSPPTPLQGRMYVAYSPLRLEPYATLDPSGDHTGHTWPDASNVSREVVFRTRSRTHMSEAPDPWMMRSATRLPSGDSRSSSYGPGGAASP